MRTLNETEIKGLEYLLGYVEAHNKFDEDRYAAEAAHYLKRFLEEITNPESN